MGQFTKRLEAITNVAVLLACCALGFWMYKSSKQTKALPSPVLAKIGTKIDLGRAQYKDAPKTLVLFLSTKCHFCSASAPFYKKASAVATDKHDKTLAVFPQAVSDAQEYSASKGFKVDEIITSSLDKFSVTGTPTVMLVNADGIILNAWVGQLSEVQEAEVLSKL